jgi:hypothetical protein
MKTVIRSRLLFAFCLAAGMQPLWADTAPDKREPVEHNLGADHFVAGCPVSVTRPIAGDLMAAGCNVDVLAEVGGDLVVMGASLRLTAPVKQSVYAAGARVLIEATVQRNLRVVGGVVELGPNSKVVGNATVAGAKVDVDGAIGGYLQVAGRTVRINGPVGGDAVVTAGDLELGPNALIEGRLRYASGHELRRNPAAQVRGSVEQFEAGPGWTETHHWGDGARRGTHLAWSLGMLVVAAVLVAALPAFTKGVADTACARWALSVLIGFIVLVCVPVAVLVALITIVGIPLALMVIALYLILLLAGYACAAIALGHAALGRWSAERAAQLGWRIGAAVLAMLLLTLLGRLPLAGWLFTLLAMLTGIGALLMQLRSAWAGSGRA